MARVLVVDDDADINAALRESLELAGYDVAGALNGMDALAEVSRQCPDLVLLDQMLPDLDGAEVCRRLRSAPESKRVPIMFLTARAGEEARVRGLALGADDYVTKPFSMQELLLRIRAVLRRATPVEVSAIASSCRAASSSPARTCSPRPSGPASTSGSRAALRRSATSRGSATGRRWRAPSPEPLRGDKPSAPTNHPGDGARP